MLLSEEQQSIFARAFNGRDTIEVDGWTSVRGRETFAVAEKAGMVRSHVETEEQYTRIVYTLTSHGKNMLAEIVGI